MTNFGYILDKIIWYPPNVQNSAYIPKIPYSNKIFRFLYTPELQNPLDQEWSQLT